MPGVFTHPSQMKASMFVDLLEPIQARGPRAMMSVLGPVAAARSLSFDIHGATLTVLVIGATGQGKSTIINALIGEHLLPVAAVPTTRRLCRLSYGPVKRATRNGKSDSIAAELIDIAGLVVLPEADEILSVALPLQRLGRWEIVDTPGLSTYMSPEMRVRYADAIRSAAVVLLVTSSQRPIGAVETTALRAVLKSRSRIVCVITHGDLTDDDVDLKRLESFHIERLERLGFGLVEVVVMPGNVDRLWASIDAMLSAAELKVLCGHLSEQIRAQMKGEQILSVRRDVFVVEEALLSYQERLSRRSGDWKHIKQLAHGINERVARCAAVYVTEYRTAVERSLWIMTDEEFGALYVNSHALFDKLLSDAESLIQTHRERIFAGVMQAAESEANSLREECARRELVFSLDVGAPRNVYYFDLLAYVKAQLFTLFENEYVRSSHPNFVHWVLQGLQRLRADLVSRIGGPRGFVEIALGDLSDLIDNAIATSCKLDIDSIEATNPKHEGGDAAERTSAGLLRRRESEAEMSDCLSLIRLIGDAGWALGSGKLRASLWRLRLLRKRGRLLQESAALHTILEGILQLGPAEAQLMLNHLGDSGAVLARLEPFFHHKLRYA